MEFSACALVWSKAGGYARTEEFGSTPPPPPPPPNLLFAHMFCFRPCMLDHALGDHLKPPGPVLTRWEYVVKDKDRPCGCVLEAQSMEQMAAAKLYQLSFCPPAEIAASREPKFNSIVEYYNTLSDLSFRDILFDCYVFLRISYLHAYEFMRG